MLRSIVGWIVRALATAATLFATIQPVLGPFAFFRAGDPVSYETLHLIVGGLLYTCALLLVLLSPFSKLRRRWPVLALGLAQYGLLHLQFRLGLGSNEDGGLLAYHIPVGVLIVLVAYLTLALAFDLLRLPERDGDRRSRPADSDNGVSFSS